MLCPVRFLSSLADANSVLEVTRGKWLVSESRRRLVVNKVPPTS